MNYMEHAVTLAPGPSARGKVCTLEGLGKTHGDRILLVGRLLPEHFGVLDNKCNQVRGVICEDGGSSDHAAIMCRSMGIPLLCVAGARSLFRPGIDVTLDPSNRVVYRGLRRLRSDAVPPAPILGFPGASAAVHLTVFGGADVRAANSCAGPLPVTGFYLSAERIWMSQGLANPFGYLSQHGSNMAKSLLKTKLRACLDAMQPGQTLNFRSLDMRSCEYPVGGETAERNPDLGWHGIRRLLKEPDLLCVELDAVAELRQEGFSNLILSLPFLNDCDEFDLVLALARQRGIGVSALGVFIETAAAVFELPGLLDRGVRHVFIGSRDLTQMILACDRSNSSVAHLYGIMKRPVLKAIELVVDACTAQGVSPVLFAMVEDAPRLLDRFPKLHTLTICYSDYKRLKLCPSKAA